MITGIEPVGATVAKVVDAASKVDVSESSIAVFTSHLSTPVDGVVPGGRAGNSSNASSNSATEIHDVMLNMELSKLQLGLIVEVRNRLLEGYQEVIRMQL